MVSRTFRKSSMKVSPSPKPQNSHIVQYNMNSPAYNKPSLSNKTRNKNSSQFNNQNIARNENIDFTKPYIRKKDPSFESQISYSENINASTDQTYSDDTNEDEISTQIELKRVYEEYIDMLQKSNEESNIIIADMKQLIDNNIEAHSVSFSNNKMKRDNIDLQKSIKKNKENYNYLMSQRNGLINIDIDSVKPADIANSVFAIKMENNLLNENCLRMDVDIQELESKITELEKDIQTIQNVGKLTSKTHQTVEDKVLQNKIEQIQDNLNLLNSIKMPQILGDTEYDNIDFSNYHVDKDLAKVRSVNSMMRRYGQFVQKNFLNIIKQFEDISEKCSLIWPKLNGFNVDETLMRQFMNEIWEQAALTDQLESLTFHIENITKNAGLSSGEETLDELVDLLKSKF